jgi:hypothetical protein
MKTTFFLFIAAMFLSMASMAQEQTIATPDSIVFDKLEHDYGTIEQGSNGEIEFKFTNKGKVPIVLSNVSATCGCTTPTWPRNPILPGEKGTIKVGYNTSIVGAFAKSITVTSNAKNPTVSLRIKGNVTPKNQ